MEIDVKSNILHSISLKRWCTYSLPIKCRCQGTRRRHRRCSRGARGYSWTRGSAPPGSRRLLPWLRSISTGRYRARGTSLKREMLTLQWYSARQWTISTLQITLVVSCSHLPSRTSLRTLNYFHFQQCIAWHFRHNINSVLCTFMHAVHDAWQREVLLQSRQPGVKPLGEKVPSGHCTSVPGWWKQQ